MGRLDVPVFRGSLVRLEPLSVHGAPDLARAAGPVIGHVWPRPR